MRITFVVAGWGLSGGDRVIAIYADRLRRRGHDVLLVAPAKPPPTWRSLVRRALAAARGAPREADEPSHLSPHVARRRLEAARAVEDRDVPDADVVVATWWETGEWVAALAPRKGAKAVFLQHYEAFDYLPKDRVDAVWRLPLHKITISHWLVELAKSKFDDGDVSLVPNSVDTTQFHAPPRGKNALPTIGMLYSNARWKGADVCLDAIAMLGFPVKVVAFSSDVKTPGTGAAPPLPAGAEFHHQPPQDFIRELYAACDVWLCGSRGEGFHLPPLEAMACRCPVVSTAVGGPLDVVQDGVNGYVVPIEDANGLADRLRRVLSLGDADWRRMSGEALHTATRYTWDDATDRFEAALRGVAARGRPPP